MTNQVEHLEEFNDAHEKLKNFVESEFKSLDYYVVFAVSKPKKDKTNVECYAGVLTNLGGMTPWATIKNLLGQIITHVQRFSNSYQVLPLGQPLVEQKPDQGEKK